MTDNRKSIDDLFAEWNTNRKQQEAEDVPDEQAARLMERETLLLDKIAAVPAMSAGEIAAKVFIAKTFTGAKWTDGRDAKMLDSIQRDLTQMADALGAGSPPVPAERLAWDMEKHVTAIGEFADTLVMLSTCPDIDEPWASIIHRMGHEIIDHNQPVEEQRMAIIHALRAQEVQS